MFEILNESIFFKIVMEFIAKKLGIHFYGKTWKNKQKKKKGKGLEKYEKRQIGKK